MYVLQDQRMALRSLMFVLLAWLLVVLFSTPSHAFGLAAGYAGEPLHGGNNKLYFFDGQMHQQWQTSSVHVDKGFPKPIKNQWISLPTYLDAAVYIGIKSLAHPNKLLFFKNNEYWRWDVTTGSMDYGYPKRVTDDFPGLPHRIDAAVYAPYHQSNRQDKLYFFRRGQYWRWDVATNRLDPGYPKRIQDGWSGLPEGGIDMAVYSGTDSGAASNKLFLFQGGRYWRWDINTDLLDPGYPKSVQKNWPGLRY